MINKKAVSPIIGWVLLFGFAISTATFVGMWMLDQAENIEIPGAGPDIYCNDVKLSINNVCKNTNNKTIDFNITNTGNFKVWRYTVGRDTTPKPDQWCLQLNTNLNPGDEQSFKLSIDGQMDSVIGGETPESWYADCTTILTPSSLETVNEAKFIPWIRIEDEMMYCPYQNLILTNSNSNLNIPC